MTIKIRHAGTSIKHLVTMINKQHISAVTFINSKPNKRNIPSLLILQAIIGGAWSLFINPLSKHRLISLSRKYILVTQPVCIKIYLICVTCVCVHYINEYFYHRAVGDGAVGTVT